MAKNVTISDVEVVIEFNENNIKMENESNKNSIISNSSTSLVGINLLLTSKVMINTTYVAYLL